MNWYHLLGLSVRHAKPWESRESLVLAMPGDSAAPGGTLHLPCGGELGRNTALLSSVAWGDRDRAVLTFLGTAVGSPSLGHHKPSTLSALPSSSGWVTFPRNAPGPCSHDVSAWSSLPVRPQPLGLSSSPSFQK